MAHEWPISQNAVALVTFLRRGTVESGRISRLLVVSCPIEFVGNRAIGVNPDIPKEQRSPAQRRQWYPRGASSPSPYVISIFHGSSMEGRGTGSGYRNNLVSCSRVILIGQF